MFAGKRWVALCLSTLRFLCADQRSVLATNNANAYTFNAKRLVPQINFNGFKILIFW
jgi:hypothetical protein